MGGGRSLKTGGTIPETAKAVNLPIAFRKGNKQMGTYQVTCTKKDGADADRRIDAFAGPGWRGTIDEVISWMDQGHKFWTTADGKSVWCKLGVHPTTHRRFVTTEGDSFPPNNLLKFRDCP